jgi:hypothetical protein
MSPSLPLGCTSKKERESDQAVMRPRSEKFGLGKDRHELPLVTEIIGHTASLVRKFNAKIAAALGKYADGDIFDRLQRLRDGVQASSNRSPKIAEFDLFASGRTEIGQPSRSRSAQPSASNPQAKIRKIRTLQI